MLMKLTLEYFLKEWENVCEREREREERVDFINIHFFARTGWEAFFGAQIEQTLNSFWQNAAHKFGLNFVCEIEDNFFAYFCFAWQTKIGEIGPKCDSLK